MKSERLQTWMTEDGRALMRESGDGRFLVLVSGASREELRELRDAIDEALELDCEI